MKNSNAKEKYLLRTLNTFSKHKLFNLYYKTLAAIENLRVQVSISQKNR